MLSFSQLFKQQLPKNKKQRAFTLSKNIITDSLYYQWRWSTLCDEEISYTCITRTSALCCLWWENSREQNSVSECAHWTNHRCFSGDSSEGLWLANAFISSTELRVIGYNAQHCKCIIKINIMEQISPNIN